MTIQEIDNKIKQYEIEIFTIKMDINSFMFSTNINELISKRMSLKHKVRDLKIVKERQLKLERILNENKE